MLGTSKNIWGFDPRSVPGCSLWLDAADSSTITGTTTVTQWRDKSGNVRHLGVGSGTTSYSSNAIQLANSYMFVTSAVNLTNLCVFIVAKTTGGYNQTVFVGRPNSSFDYTSVDGFGFYMDSQSVIRFYGTSSGGQYSTFNVNTSTPQLFSFQSSGTSISAWYNGNSQTGGTLGSSRTSTAQGFAIGASWNGSTSSYDNIIVNASLYEIIVFNSDVTTSQRQQVEGYLSHKWGLNGYYDSSIPLSIPGCQFWLDGADPAATGVTPSNGATVSTWVDKSGNGYNATAAPSRTAGTYSTSFRAVNFPTSTTGYITSYSAAPTNETMFVVFNNPSPSQANNILIGGVQGARSLGAGHTNPGGTGSVGNLNTQVNWLASTGGGTYTSGTTVLTTSQFTTSTNTISLNGGTAASGGAPGFTAGRVTYLGVDATNGSYYYVGYAMEILFYNSVLNTTQRQSIEGYLARKWGLTSMYSALPSIHPFSSIRPHLRTFQPTDIPGCQLWLDAADTSTLVLSGSNVTQWNDKSGNGRNGTLFQNYPTYTTNRVNFNGTQGLATSLSPSTNIESGFVICGFTSVSSVNTLIGSFVSENGGRQFRVNNAIQTIKQDIVAVLTSGTSLENNTTYLCEYVNNGTTLTHYLNGNSYASGGSVTYTAGGNITSIGYRSNNNGYNEGLYGYIQEVLIFSTALTTSQRQQVEGYLAHKWGLTTPIPSTHPFKSILPASLPFSPRNISTLALWLDGADSSQLTFSSSSNVNTWIDKSGFNNSSSNQSLGTTITYPGTKVNGLNTVNFTAGCIRGAFNGSSVINTTDVTMFIVTAETAPNDNLRMFSLTPAANYQDDQASNMLIYCAPGNYQLTFYRGGAMPTPYTVTQNVPFIYSLTQTSGTGSMWLNGGSNRTASITTSAFAVTNYNIGTQYLANQNYTGLMCEVVVYNTLLNTSQRQQVEGYLAQKWGLITLLPSTHPYVKLPA